MPDESTQLAVITTKLDRMREDVKDIRETMQSRYVTQEEFRPIRVFVYGTVGLALVAIGTAVVNGVLK